MRTLADLYQEYVVDLDPVLWEMGRINGIHVDNEARLALLSTMNAQVKGLQDDAQAFVPEKLFPLKHYKTLPTTSRPIIEIPVPSEKVKTCTQCGAQHVTQGEHTARKGGRGDVPLNPCYKAPIELRPGINIEYDVRMPFNPGSDDQLRLYAEMFKHSLGRNWKTEEDTLDAKQVQKMINKYGTKHPMYRYALEIRKVRKARGYAKAWQPNPEGLLFGQFKNVPETFRLSQSNHNFMNVSHRGNVPYAKELRRLLVAPPGYLLVEADSSSIEAVFSGSLMGSPGYIRLATKGIHAAWLLQSLGLDASVENIATVKNAGDHEAFWATLGKTSHEIELLYERKKRTVHGVSYGMGAKLLFESYPEFFASKAAAQAEIDDFYGFVPELQEWHKDTQQVAFKQGYLQSPWGFRNYYYRVFSFDWRTQKYRLGEDAKAAIAFQPQHANGMFQRENLKLIHQTVRKMGKQDTWKQTAIGHVHDSNGLRVPEDDADKAAGMLAEIMNRPIKQFGGLQVGVQVKAGRNWQDTKAIKTV